MADILFKRGKESQLPAAKDGQILFATDTGNMFIDDGSKHIQINADKANQLKETVGSSAQPVWFDNGVPTETEFQLNATVPENAKFTDTNTWRKVQLNGTDKLGTGTSTKPLNLKAGTNVSITESSGTFTFSATDTTYSAATTSAAGLMSAADKTKLDGIALEANKYTHPSHTKRDSGLYKITVNELGHVTAATAVTKSDITGLGIPGSDTDTHYESKNIVGASSSAVKNASASGGSVYLNHIENGLVTSTHKITGSGSVAVAADTNGNITITGTDNDSVTGVSGWDNTKLFIVGTSAQATTPSVTNTNSKVYIRARRILGRRRARRIG